MAVEQVQATWVALEQQVAKVVQGQQQVLRLMMIGLLCEGHVLLEGVPGIAKTLLARTFAASLDVRFSRIQFTPDLMPGDVLGTNLFDFRSNEFTLTKGPIFTDLLLADEINRCPPKTQAALLESMQERTVTIGGTAHALGSAFMVVATQNPIEHEGTYPLPEAQLDRFLFKLLVGYPERDEERSIVRLHGNLSATTRLDAFDLQPVADAAFLGDARATVAQVRLAEEIVDYVVDLARGSRDHPALQVGASPRATSMLASAARAAAVMDGRAFVIPDDVKYVFPAVMRHRLLLSPGAEVEGTTIDDVLLQLVDQVPAPR